MELLYIADDSGRYIVGNYEYAVTAGDFAICNADVPHGEDPFQEHHIQTYCLVLSGVKLELAEDERPIISFGKESFLADLLPKLYQFFHSRKDYYDICRQFAAGIFLLLKQKLSEREKNPVRLKRGGLH